MHGRIKREDFPEIAPGTLSKFPAQFAFWEKEGLLYFSSSNTAILFGLPYIGNGNTDISGNFLKRINLTVHTLTFKKTCKPILDSRWFYIQASILLSVCLWIAYEETIFLAIIGFYIGIPLLLQTVLHLNYFLHDRKVQLTINRESEEIIFTKRSKAKHVKFKNIKAITRFQGSRYPKPYETYVIPSNFYHYTMIETVNGDVILFSDFICSGLGIYFPNKDLQIRPFLNVISK